MKREQGSIDAWVESLRNALGTVLVLGVGALLGVALVSWGGRDRPSAAVAEEGAARSTGDRPDFAPIVDQLLPAVVSIDVEKRFRHGDLWGGDDVWQDEDPGLPDEEFQIPSSGSGFVIDAAGHIITNDHVVRDGVRIDVHFNHGETLPARLVGRDPMTDIAVLQVTSDRPLPSVTLGNSDGLRIGDWVVAVGNPLGMLEGSVTAGIVSAKGRTDLAIRGGGPTYQDFIQTDASINPGNSGGPLIDLNGEVVGVNSAYNAGGGIGFAISINIVREVADELISRGRVARAFLGVNLMTLAPDLARGWGMDNIHGVVVTDVQDDTPAAEAGLEAGDVITEFNDMPVSQVSPFRLLVARSEIGARVPVRFLRKGRPRETTVRLTERLDPLPELPVVRPVSPVTDLGLFVSQFDYEDGGAGVQVDSIAVGSPAERAGIRAGDIVIEVGWDDIGSIEELRREIAADIDERGVVVLWLQRGENRSFVSIRPQ